MKKKNQNNPNLNRTISNIFGFDVETKRVRKSQITIRRELFISIIESLESLMTRSDLLFGEYRLDFTIYNEPFFNIIDDLLYLNFGTAGCELVDFYLYKRENIDGSENMLVDDEGNQVPLDTPEDLWNLLKNIDPKKDAE